MLLEEAHEATMLIFYMVLTGNGPIEISSLKE